MRIERVECDAVKLAASTGLGPSQERRWEGRLGAAWEAHPPIVVRVSYSDVAIAVTQAALEIHTCTGGVGGAGSEGQVLVLHTM